VAQRQAQRVTAMLEGQPQGRPQSHRAQKAGRWRVRGDGSSLVWARLSPRSRGQPDEVAMASPPHHPPQLALAKAAG